jgi:TolB-like protein/DNA-binding winged helix-turn-helix (wHTH) protein/tetratricopeptide (TPR) repeat protein
MQFGVGAGYRFGPFILNLERLCLQEAGADLDLRPKAFDVLRVLVENSGRLVTKDELVKAAWPNVIVNDDALAQCIRDIRKALKDEGDLYIRTVPRRGYEFVAEVTPLRTLHQRVVSLEAMTRPAGRWLRLGTLGALLVLVVVALVAWGVGWFAPKQAVSETRLTIAVLPFATAGEAGEEWFGDGIAEDIMTAVSRFRDLTVVARNSSFRYRNAVDARQVGQELGADFLLQGTVRRSEDRLRITAQLVDATSGTSRWSERYDRPFSDVFEIQDEVAASVAGHLVIHAKEAAVSRLRSKPPSDMQAYELALRARKAYLTFTRDSAIEARTLAERSIAIDPDYAAGWEVLAACLLQFYLQPYGKDQHDPAMLQLARKAAEKAVSLDGNFATAQAMLAFTLMWSKEHEASLAAIERALALNPSDSVAHGIHANVLMFSGRYREAVAAFERYFKLDPFNPAINLALKSMPHIMLGEYDEALRLTRSCMERAPRVFACSLYRATAAGALDLEEETRQAVARVNEINPAFTIAQHMRVRPFGDEAEAARLAAHFRRAGLPE